MSDDDDGTLTRKSNIAGALMRLPIIILSAWLVWQALGAVLSLMTPSTPQPAHSAPARS